MKLTTLASAALAAGAMTIASAASAALYTTNFGTAFAGWPSDTPSNCDDCFAAPTSFGAGQSINFFGSTYNNLYVGSNGYVTFGAGASSFSPSPLNTQTVGKMIAGLFTDLDSRLDGDSKVWVNTASLGQIIVTWEDMGHYNFNYGVRSTFQLVIRSDQFAAGAGEGQIGFFYDRITDGSLASAGFGDGLAAINPGEVAFYNGSASGLNNSAPRWYNLAGGIPDPTGVPEPGTFGLLGASLLGFIATRRRKQR